MAERRHPPSAGLITDAAGAADVPGTEALLFAASAQAATLRLGGSSTQALALIRQISPVVARIEQRMIDNSGGLMSFMYLQGGITALVADNAVDAHAWLRRAEDVVSDLRFGFIARDAAAKLAVAQALYCSSSAARASISRVVAHPRSTSWVEPWIDDTVEIAEALLEADDPLAGPRGETPQRLRSLGEMWPFALWARVRHLLRTHSHDRLSRTIDEVEAMRLPGSDGDGFTGAVIPMARTCLALARGRVSQAREALEHAPDTPIYVQLLRARVLLVSGEIEKASGAAASVLDASPGFLRTRVPATGILAGAALARDDMRTAERLVAEIVRECVGEESHLSAWLPADVLHFARRSQVACGLGGQAIVPVFPKAAEFVELSQRQRQVLALLASGAERQEIAAELFISDNTVKSHLRAVYRALGVDNRTDAVNRAILLGLTSPR